LGPAPPPQHPLVAAPAAPGGASDPAPVAAGLDQATITAIAASIQAVMQPRLDVLQSQIAAMQSTMASADSLPLLPRLVPPPPSLAPSAIPPPHRVGPLGVSPRASAELTALIERVSQGPPTSQEDDEKTEVRPQALTLASTRTSAGRINFLPDAFIPLVPGSIQDNNQMLASLISSFHKREVKYPTLTALDTALGEWWESAIAAHWAAAQLSSLYEYRYLLIHRMGPVLPLAKILEYHRLWTKAVYAGTHDMFGPTGHINMAALLNTGLVLTQASSSTSFSSASSSGKGKKALASAAAAAAKPAQGETKADEHPAGSCTNHPLSTTHTTAECRKK
jgi:hypothetical protein